MRNSLCRFLQKTAKMEIDLTLKNNTTPVKGAVALDGF
jgi:hypothetical protein